jgi:hypothetical protein
VQPWPSTDHHHQMRIGSRASASWEADLARRSLAPSA